MLIWMIIIIILTISMILSYYLVPDTPEVVIVNAYAILLVTLGIFYRVLRKTRTGKLESMLGELNYLRMRIEQLENQEEEEIIDEKESEL